MGRAVSAWLQERNWLSLRRRGGVWLWFRLRGPCWGFCLEVGWRGGRYWVEGLGIM